MLGGMSLLVEKVGSAVQFDVGKRQIRLGRRQNRPLMLCFTNVTITKDMQYYKKKIDSGIKDISGPGQSRNLLWADNQMRAEPANQSGRWRFVCGWQS